MVGGNCGRTVLIDGGVPVRHRSHLSDYYDEIAPEIRNRTQWWEYGKCTSLQSTDHITERPSKSFNTSLPNAEPRVL
jgi:hypothetical protein